MARHNDTGKWGEELAAETLRGKGYTIIERDWHSGHRDIDIIARSPDSRTIVFVEVKTRTQDVITKPEDAVDEKKIRNIAYAANNYVKMHNVVDELRFDLITIVGENPEVAKVEHIVDAFNPLLCF
jgi:putative endonuclease